MYWTIEEVKLAKIALENENSYYRYNSCTVYIVLIIVFLQFLLELQFILFIIIGLWLK